jgi:hypothetical protein
VRQWSPHHRAHGKRFVHAMRGIARGEARLGEVAQRPVRAGRSRGAARCLWAGRGARNEVGAEALAPAPSFCSGRPAGYRAATAAPAGAHGSQHGSQSGGQSPQSAADIVSHAAGFAQAAAFFALLDEADTVAATPSAMIATRATVMARFFMGFLSSNRKS